MKKSILSAVLSTAAAVSGLMAQGAAPAPPAAGAPAAPKGPQPKSQAELTALQTLFAAQGNPDAMIKAAEDLLVKFADTEFKETAFTMEAGAYQEKRDNTKAQLFAEKALEINPNSLNANIMMADILVSTTGENDLDKNEKLTRADKHANNTIQILSTLAKPNPQLTDEQWVEFKKSMVGRSHSSMGLANLTRKKYDAAVAEFKIANENDPQPAYLVRQASALQLAGKNDEALAIVDKILADPTVHPTIAGVARSIKANATKK